MQVDTRQHVPSKLVFNVFDTESQYSFWPHVRDVCLSTLPEVCECVFSEKCSYSSAWFSVCCRDSIIVSFGPLSDTHTLYFDIPMVLCHSTLCVPVELRTCPHSPLRLPGLQDQMSIDLFHDW